MKIVGINHTGYNTTRNISSLPFKNYRVEKKRDLFKYPEHLYYRLTGQIHPVLLNLHQDFGLSNCDIWHFFNTVSFTKTPWVTTFETITPRYHGRYQPMGVKLIAGKHCKKLIAMSDCAKNLQLEFIKTKYPEYYSAVSEKIVTIHPSQKLLLQNYADKQTDDSLNLIIIGTEFFRKGGSEVLHVIDRLLSEGEHIKLHIVSKMQYEGTNGTIGDYNRAMEIIGKHSNNIFHYDFLPNHEVLNLLLKCQVALLPSYKETYGYSILEAQAAGCPVITTDILAFGEINNNHIGWLINVPCDEMKRPKVNTQEERKQFSGIIKIRLEEILRNIIKSPEQVKVKAKASLDKVNVKNNPVLVAEKIEEVYNEALR